MPHLLEPFSGTGSMGRAFRSRGWQVTSVDIDPKALPTICCDILELEIEDVLEHGNVDLIWASPPCTHYSCARTNARTPRDLDGSDALVRKVLDLADQLFCYYLLENPHSGLLKTRPVVRDLRMCVCWTTADTAPPTGREPASGRTLTTSPGGPCARRTAPPPTGSGI